MCIGTRLRYFNINAALTTVTTKTKNIVDKEPADMHGEDGIRFTESQKAKKEQKEREDETLKTSLKKNKK